MVDMSIKQMEHIIIMLMLKLINIKIHIVKKKKEMPRHMNIELVQLK